MLFNRLSCEGPQTRDWYATNLEFQLAGSREILSRTQPNTTSTLAARILTDTLALEGPVFLFHEAFQRHARNTEVTTDIGNLRPVRRLAFKRHDRAACIMCARNDERVCIETTLQELLSFDDLAEVRDRENLPDETRLGCVWRWKQIASALCPLAQCDNPVSLDLAGDFACGCNFSALDQFIKLRPKSWEAVAVVTVEQLRKCFRIEDLAQGALLEAYSSRRVRFLGLVSRMSAS